MFKRARLKLTAWYLSIIILVVLLFSLIIYKEADMELQRIERRQQAFNERVMPIPPGRISGFGVIELVDVNNIRHRIIFVLSVINAGILIIAGGAGYFLSGRTLKPINDMMEEQNRFVADASHELRTPLTALKTATEVGLRDKKLTVKEARTVLQDSLRQINNLKYLSDNLLKLLRLENNQPDFSRVDLSQAIQEAIEKIQPLADLKNIAIQFSPKKLSVTGNKESLTELFLILLDNAVKYSSPKTRVTITMTKDGEELITKVTDEGRGITGKDLPHIYDRFYRADKARTKSESNGFGLGLSIAKNIVHRHRGSIEAKSIVGKGTTFVVGLPIHQSRQFD